jgi:hypothetical protein
MFFAALSHETVPLTMNCSFQMRTPMIRNEFEYKRALAHVTECHLAIVERREQLRESGCLGEEADKALCRLKFVCGDLKDQIELYERRTARTWVPAQAGHLE